MEEFLIVLVLLLLGIFVFVDENDYDEVCVNGESYISVNGKHFYKLEDKDIFCKQEGGK